MAHGLPDFQSSVEATLTEVTSIQHGLDAAKSASPASGDAYLATDTAILYVCFTDGSWTNVGNLYLLLAGGTLTGDLTITKATPALFFQTPGGRKLMLHIDGSDNLACYVDDGVGGWALLWYAVTGTAAPTLNLNRALLAGPMDANNQDIGNVLCTQAQPARSLGTEYQNTSGKIMVVSVSCTPAAQALIGKVKATSPADTTVAVDGPASGVYSSITFIVPLNYYYTAVCASGTNLCWTEWSLL